MAPALFASAPWRALGLLTSSASKCCMPCVLNHTTDSLTSKVWNWAMSVLDVHRWVGHPGCSTVQYVYGAAPSCGSTATLNMPQIGPPTVLPGSPRKPQACSCSRGPEPGCPAALLPPCLPSCLQPTWCRCRWRLMTWRGRTPTHSSHTSTSWAVSAGGCFISAIDPAATSCGSELH